MVVVAMPSERLSPLAAELKSSLPLRWLDRFSSHMLFILNGYLSLSQKWDGPIHHQRLKEWIACRGSSETDLRDWLQGRLHPQPFRPKLFDQAQAQANRWEETGWWAAVWNTPLFEADPAPGCPQVLFGQGPLPVGQAWAAVFNSRKAKVSLPEDRWLKGLRCLWPELMSRSLGIVSSTGTLTYDLVTACAQEAGVPLLLVVPETVEALLNSKSSPLIPEAHPERTLMTCMGAPASCPKRARLVCRDRLLVRLADLHCILELRAAGNLVAILQEQQHKSPRFQWIIEPARRCASTEGNFRLAERFPQWARMVSVEDRNIALKPAPPEAPLLPSPKPTTWVIDWKAYLYHYTRACPGPWPGEPYRDYLLKLFDCQPLSGHTSLDTLIRMVQEGRIRAGARLIRGKEPVVSWTAQPPLELNRIRRWNPGLIRWTFEPYGIAIRRERIRSLGARPVIYAPGSRYAHLKPHDRFRFQRHEPPRCAWKQEREWRLPQDCSLEAMAGEDGFIFLPNRHDAQRLAHQATVNLPLVVLEDFTFDSGAVGP